MKKLFQLLTKPTLFKKFEVKPAMEIRDQLFKLVKDSDDPEITTAILNTFEFKTNNLGVFGLALEALGFVKDPRAMVYLMYEFDQLENTLKIEKDP